MGNPTTIKSITDQAHIMASTGKAVSDQVKSFDRFIAVSAGQTCCDSSKNGHITPDAAVRHGQELAEAILASLPASVDMDAKLAAVAITVTTRPRFQCSRGCKFGHKTQAMAQACSDGSQARQARQVRASIPVTSGGALSDLLASLTQTQPQPTQEPTQPTQATQEPTQAKPRPQAKPRLTSGAQGNTGKA